MLKLLGLVMFLTGSFGLIVCFLTFPCFRPVRQALLELIFPSNSNSQGDSPGSVPRQRIPSRKEHPPACAYDAASHWRAGLEIARSGRCLHCQGECGPEIWLKFQSCQRCWISRALRKERTR